MTDVQTFATAIYLLKILGPVEFWNTISKIAMSLLRLTVLGKEKFDKLIIIRTLEALFISEIKPALNTNDEFKIRNLLLKL